MNAGSNISRIWFYLIWIALVQAQIAFATEELEYVGSESCASCHQTQFKLWRGSHHDLAMQIANDQTVLGDFNDSTFTQHEVTTRFFKKNDRFIVNTPGSDGKLQDFEIKYTFGVEPLQQYLIEFPNGALQTLGVAWDTRAKADGGQRWFHVYGDELINHNDELHWTNRAQTWNYQCADCHSLNVRKNYDQTSDSYATTWDVIDVGCEGCHGPASEHVRLAPNFTEADTKNKGLSHRLTDTSGGRWIREKDQPIAHRSTALTSDIEINTCARCHSRRGQLRERPYQGQSFLDDYRPALLNTPLYHLDGQINDEVYVYGSFLQSRMHQAGVVCSDCHDPHSGQLKAEGNTLCTTCHAPEVFDVRGHHHHAENSTAAQCVECHMPAKNYMIVDSRRDHSMRIPRPDLSIYLGTPNACTSCHEDKSDQWAADLITQWRGSKTPRLPDHVAFLAATRGAEAMAQQAAVGLTQDTSAPAILRAAAARTLGRYSAREVLPALAQAGGDENGLLRLGAIEALANGVPALKLQVAIPNAYDDLLSVRTGAARVLATIPAGQLPEQTREPIENAMAEYAATQVLQSDHPNALSNLGAYYADRANWVESEANYKRALRLAPTHLGAIVGLADLYRQIERDAEGAELLADAIAQLPNVAELHHSLGLTYVRQKNPVAALSHLARATELAPNNRRFHYVLAVARQSYGKPIEAIKALEQTMHRFPNDAQFIVLLAELHRATGDLDKAIGYAKRLVEISPGDQRATEFLKMLEDSSN